MELNFVYCFDENFNFQALASIRSLLDKITTKANIFIIHKNTNSFHNISNSILGHNNLSGLHCFQFDSTFLNLPPTKSHVSEATFYRLFISEYIPHKIDHLIYLDADIICINDPSAHIIKVLNEMSKDNTLIAAKPELSRDRNKQQFENLNLSGDNYFNAGVLFINYKKWLSDNIQEKLINIIEERFDIIEDYDQEIINIFFDQSITKIDNNLNFQATSADSHLMDKIKKEVIFLHYLGKTKPWYIDGILNPISKFYQDEYRKLGLGKYHLVFNKDKQTLVKFFNIIFKLRFLKLRYPFYYLIKSFKKMLF